MTSQICGIQKRGSKGVSYVCSVKRKFRNPSTVFTDTIQQLIAFLEKNPDIHISQLAKRFLGIDIKQQLPLVNHEENSSNDQSGKKSNFANKNAGKVKVEDSRLSEDSPVIEGLQKETSDLSAINETKCNISSVDKARLKQTMLDLRWLIMEGYVTEYGNSKIFAPPPMPEPKNYPSKVVSYVEKASLKTAVQSEDKSATKEKVLKDGLILSNSSEEHGPDIVPSAKEHALITDNLSESTNKDNGDEVMGLESPCLNLKFSPHCYSYLLLQ